MQKIPSNALHEDFSRSSISSAPSVKNFGYTFSAIFFTSSIYCFFIYQSYFLYSSIIFSLFLLFTIFWNAPLIPLHKLWNFFGLKLHSFMSPLILLFIYFIAIIPTSMLVKLFFKDFFKLSYRNNLDSYWVQPDNIKTNMFNQF